MFRHATPGRNSAHSVTATWCSSSSTVNSAPSENLSGATTRGYRTVGDRERAQDLVQETFVRVYRHLHRFDQSKKFSTWIYTIAGNLAKNELRNRSRNPLVLFQTIKKNWDADHRPLEWEDETTMPDDLFRKRHLREKVEEAVQQLPEHHRLVFVLREIEGRSYEEIAEITETNLGTVKSRLNRARNNFARIIAPLVD
jgi:RNA polymerase sigma-70 factor, ECF subfamily